MLEMCSYVEPKHSEPFDRAAIILRALANEFAPPPKVLDRACETSEEAALMSALSKKLIGGSAERSSPTPRRSPERLHFDHIVRALAPFESPRSEADALTLAKRIIDALGAMRTKIARHVDQRLARRGFFDPLPRDRICAALGAMLALRAPRSASEAVQMVLAFIGYPRPENLNRG